MRRRHWPAAVLLLHLLAGGCAALPTLQPPPPLHTERLQLRQDDGLGGESVTVTLQPEAGAPARTLDAAAYTTSDTDRLVNEAASGTAADPLSETADVSSEDGDALGQDEDLYEDEDDDAEYETTSLSSGAPGRPAVVTGAPLPELTSAAASGQHCPQLCVCFDLTVDCSSRELRQLPDALPNWTQVL